MDLHVAQLWAYCKMEAARKIWSESILFDQFCIFTQPIHPYISDFSACAFPHTNDKTTLPNHASNEKYSPQTYSVLKPHRRVLCVPQFMIVWFAAWDICLTCCWPQSSHSSDETGDVCYHWHTGLICVCYFQEKMKWQRKSKSMMEISLAKMKK